MQTLHVYAAYSVVKAVFIDRELKRGLKVEWGSWGKGQQALLPTS